MKKENGLTLVEMVVALAISSLVLIIGFSILISMMKVKEETQNKTILRNEMQYIIKELDNILLNTDQIVIEGELDENGFFQKFIAKDIRHIQKTTGEYEEIEHASTTIEIQNKKLLIDGKPVHSDQYTTNEAPFSQQRGSLLLHLIVTDDASHESYEVKKWYRLGEGD